jgi:hypothetical protein
MEAKLTYAERPDWGDKPFGPWYAKWFGLTVCLLACGHLLKDHMHQAPVCLLAFEAAIAVVLAVFVAANFRAKPDKDRPFWVWYVLAIILLNGIGLLRTLG